MDVNQKVEVMDKVLQPVVFLSVGFAFLLLGIFYSGSVTRLQGLAFTIMFGMAAAAFIIGAAMLKRGR